MSVFKPHFKPSFSHRQLWLIGLFGGTLLSLTIFITIFCQYYQNRLFQGIYIDQVYVGGLTYEEASIKLNRQALSFDSQATLSLSYQDIKTQVPLRSLVSGKNYAQALENAVQLGHAGSLIQRLTDITNLLRSPRYLATAYQYDTQQINLIIQALKTEIDQPGQAPSFILHTSGQATSLEFISGIDGQILQTDQTLATIVATLDTRLTPESTPVNISLSLENQVKNIDRTLSDIALAQAWERAQAMVGKQLTFYSKTLDENEVPDHTIIQKIVNDQRIIELLTWPDGYDRFMIAELVTGWSDEINQPPKNAVFEYNPNTLEVTQFQAHEYGLELNQAQTLETFIELLQQTKQTILQAEAESVADENLALDKIVPEQSGVLTLQRAEPEISLAETNDLGINELIGFGDSHYYHSIPTRIHNVSVATSKLNFAVVAPGEEFSFNGRVGDVDGDSGFKTAYVIKEGQTLLEFGGGVCQVSTTTFRALLDAGVDITRRLPHSYRVSYYEYEKKPGFDATVYAGNVDLRFINDTPGYILIIAEADSADVYMAVKIYGTNDGRISEISNYQQWGHTSPPEAQYIPDPTLAPGVVKQVEHAISGIKTSFDWLVLTADGQTLHEKTFYSNFHAWGAKYLVGE